MRHGTLAGAELQDLRRLRGLSRTTLAALARVHPHTIRYWERKATVDLRGYAPDRILRALGLAGQSRRGTYPGPRFSGFFASITRARDGGLVQTDLPAVTTRTNWRCGARTRKGTPCRAKALPGKTRCRFHGGLSTGPKTREGRDRIAEAQRRRWARWRVEQRRPEKT
ncbi:helix-turn-helix domain-containing protein [Antarcticimicrobium sediminis]|uniref:XRE family transcriptional regulator n=1 Tax=Antarcticimicrobium sediminis TaxID=2546227 RepID=A0A4R5EKV0_9RHOB|nr:helix-turn-helix transcriptional regulator [Antarcticimicrobium sediminis]TDE35057.1 XRE family transcriptional regulator [Antarcticimicrobium sediminis]